MAKRAVYGEKYSHHHIMGYCANWLALIGSMYVTSIGRGKTYRQINSDLCTRRSSIRRLRRARAMARPRRTGSQVENRRLSRCELFWCSDSSGTVNRSPPTYHGRASYSGSGHSKVLEDTSVLRIASRRALRGALEHTHDRCIEHMLAGVRGFGVVKLHAIYIDP